MTALVVGALGLVSGMYFVKYGPDQQVGDVTAAQVVRAATDGTVAMLSYSPDSLDEDFARARSHLAGDLLAYYSEFSEQIMAPTAKERQTATSARVIRAAVSELHENLAVVLVFVSQSTTTKDSPEPTVTDTSALATMVDIDGSWLIAKFDRL